MKHRATERKSKRKVCDGKTKSGNWMEQWRKGGRHTDGGRSSSHTDDFPCPEAPVLPDREGS